MKLNRLDSTTQHHSADSVERTGHGVDEKVLRVEAADGLEGDRQRSLQQEIAEFDGKAIGPFGGGERILASAREVAAQLTSLGAGAGVLLKETVATGSRPKVDDKA